MSAQTSELVSLPACIAIRNPTAVCTSPPIPHFLRPKEARCPNTVLKRKNRAQFVLGVTGVRSVPQKNKGKSAMYLLLLILALPPPLPLPLPSPQFYCCTPRRPAFQPHKTLACGPSLRAFNHVLPRPSCPRNPSRRIRATGSPGSRRQQQWHTRFHPRGHRMCSILPGCDLLITTPSIQFANPGASGSTSNLML